MTENARDTENMENTPGGEAAINPRQERLIEALLAGNSIIASAKIAGCNEKTARRWLKQNDVQAAYRTAQRVVFNEALSCLMIDIGDARAVLCAIMRDTEAPESSRVRAAQIILEQAIASYRTGELEERLCELEAARTVVP
jgi:hypothetical protein